MRPDYDDIKNNFLSIHGDLEKIAVSIEENLEEIFNEFKHKDRVGCRVKAVDSFLKKTLKLNKEGGLKYKEPLKEIQDMIGARIIVYYRNDVEEARKKIKEYYQSVEQTKVIPDELSKFGYEGFHLILSIPNSFYPTKEKNPYIPDFFELQIKTLYQHAWSQAEHGLGYKTDTSLSPEDERKLAFIAAQSWGADTILEQLVNAQANTNESD